MRETLKRLAKMAIGYGAVTWAGPLFSLFLTPIITRLVPPSGMGVYGLLTAVATAISTVSLFGLPQALTAHYHDREDSAWSRLVVGSALAVAVPIAMIAGTLLWAFAPAILGWFKQPQDYVTVLRLMGLTLVMGVVGAVLTSAAQAAIRVRWGMVLSLTTILSTVGGNILFVVVLRLGVVGLLLTPILTGVTTFLVALALTRSLIGRPSRRIMAVILGAGAVLLPTMAAGFVLQLADRIFLARMLPAAIATTQLGLYDSANKVAALLYVALTPVFNAWTPLALSMQHDAAARARYTSVARYLVITAVLGSAALGLFATEIMTVLYAPSYRSAAIYVGLLTLPHVFAAMQITLYVGELIQKRLGAISRAVVAGAVLNLALNWLLIPPLGVWGATLATVFGYGLTSAIFYWQIRPRLELPYPMGRFVLAVVVELLALGAGVALAELPWPERIGLKVLVYAAVMVAMIAFGLLERHEIEQGLLFARHRLRLALARVQSTA